MFEFRGRHPDFLAVKTSVIRKKKHMQQAVNPTVLAFGAEGANPGFRV